MTLHTSATGDAPVTEVLLPIAVSTQVVLTPAEFTTLQSVGAVVVSAPPSGFFLWGMALSLQWLGKTGSYNTSINVSLSRALQDSTGQYVISTAGSSSWLIDTDEAENNLYYSLLWAETNSTRTAELDGQPLVLWANTDIASQQRGIPTAVSVSTPGLGYYVDQTVEADDGGGYTARVVSVSAGGALTSTTTLSMGTQAYDVGAAITLVSATALSIIGIDQGTQTITVSGNQVSKLPVTGQFMVSGSTGNDITFTTVSATFTASGTDIVTVEPILDPTADGVVLPGVGAQITVDAFAAAESTLTVTTIYRIQAITR